MAQDNNNRAGREQEGAADKAGHNKDQAGSEMNQEKGNDDSVS